MAASASARARLAALRTEAKKWDAKDDAQRMSDQIWVAQIEQNLCLIENCQSSTPNLLASH